MSCGENKESLMVFLTEHWKSYKSSQFTGVSMMYVTAKDKCYVFFPGEDRNNPSVSRNEIHMLESNHEEADTRLLLHAKYAAITHDRVIVRSPDTDVFILCTAMQRSIGKDLFMMTGTGNRFRCININAVCNTLGDELCRCLPGFHAFSGNITFHIFLVI